MELSNIFFFKQTLIRTRNLNNDSHINYETLFNTNGSSYRKKCNSRKSECLPNYYFLNMQKVYEELLLFLLMALMLVVVGGSSVFIIIKF